MTLVGHELPEYYQPGACLSLELDPSNVPLSLRVRRAFTPFTTGQVILVELDSGKDSFVHLRLPKTFILKVYDPKFSPQRLPRRSIPARPWTLAAETTAAATRKEQNRGRDPDFEPWRKPEDDDEPSWEEWYYQDAESQYHSEISAYDRLQVFQGTTLVHCYGTGLLQLPQRAIALHALLLEFIPDAKTLDQVDPKVIPQNLIHSLLETTEQFGKLGVVHSDINPGNILLSLDHRPSRAVIIDFGEAGIREDESDAKWQEVVTFTSDTIWMHKRLHVDVIPHL